MDLSSRTISASSPGVPNRAKPGALRLAEANAALPRPPIPPRAATYSSPTRSRSAKTLPSRSFTTVPCGTVRTRSSPLKPWCISPRPISPFGACWCGLWWYSSRVVVWLSTRRITAPPLPPLPPLGPPRGLNFSRRTETQPLPPRPPDTCKTTRSTNSATGSPYLGKSSLRHRTAHTNHAADAVAGATGLGCASSWSPAQASTAFEVIARGGRLTPTPSALAVSITQLLPGC